MVEEERIKSIRRIGLVSTIVLGLLFHELYKSTGVPFLAFISPVNESKWEHWKMAYSPMVIVGTIEYVMLKRTNWKLPNYLFSIAGGIAVFELTTFGLIELYEIVFGHSHLGVHVSTFLLGAYAGHRGKYWILNHLKPSRLLTVVGAVFLIVQFVIFAFFTCNPPRLDYFKDSITQTYGIQVQP